MLTVIGVVFQLAPVPMPVSTTKNTRCDDSGRALRWRNGGYRLVVVAVVEIMNILMRGAGYLSRDAIRSATTRA